MSKKADVPYAAPTPLLFQFARYERYFNEAAMLRYARAASESKLVEWYDTGHDLNDLQALVDRANWLQKQIGIKPAAPILAEEIRHYQMNGVFYLKPRRTTRVA